MLILAKGRLCPANQTPVHCLLDGKMCSTSLGRFLEVIDNRHRGNPVFSGEQGGLERPKSVSSSQKKYRTGNESTLPCDSTVDLFLL